MNDEQALTDSQVIGAFVGAAVGTTKGSALGMSACLAATPILGPFAILLLPLGSVLGAYTGVKIGSKGLGRAAMMAASGPVMDGIADHLKLNGITFKQA